MTKKNVFATLALGIRQNSGNQILMSNSKLCRFSFLYLGRRFIGRLLGFRRHEIEATQSLKMLINDREGFDLISMLLNFFSLCRLL